VAEYAWTDTLIPLQIYITKQFREIIYTKFRDISQNKVQQNFAKFREIFKKILFRDHPTFDVHKPKKYLHISVPDPWDFSTYTDPQIRPGSGPVFLK
jgi:hypothetical protein